jgi:hypothetical protein
VLSLETFTYNRIAVGIIYASTVHNILEKPLNAYVLNLSAVSEDTLQAYSSSAHWKLKGSQNFSL